MNTNWLNRISNIAQVGGIETSVLDNGAGRGTRIAWINTGTGLRYKVVIDRAMDIADAFFNEKSLAWISHGGVTAPQPFSGRGIDWLQTFGGGLLTTCGLSHVGGPEENGIEPRGLHGRISNTPADLISVIQPDPAAGNMEMSISGKMKETQVLGPGLELHRTISSALGQASVKISDTVINKGNQAAPHMLLYHCNFGWPLVDEGAEIRWKGSWKAREKDPKIFREGNDFRKCPAPLNEHSGRGEEAVFVDVSADGSGLCSCGLLNRQAGLALRMRFRKDQLPWLTNWQHWGKGEYVTGLEPGTNRPIGQSGASSENELIVLQPGESRQYELEMDIITSDQGIRDFINSTE